MDKGDLRERIREWITRYRWAALILAAGLLMMTLPTKKPAPEDPASASPQQIPMGLEQRLEEVLSRLEGAGKTAVLLTQSTGAEYHYQTDTDSQQQGDHLDRRVQTVTITGSDRAQQGLIRRTDPPKYLGAVVLCQGADRPAVRLAVVEAVSTVTGLRTDQITVLKMK